MRFGVRVFIGAAVAAILAGVLGTVMGSSTWTAVTGAIAAPIAFLATFFIWDADRPEEGYEQVLFDRPNSVVAVLLIVAFAGAGIGSGYVMSALDAPDAPTSRSLSAVAADYDATVAAFEASTLDAAAATARLDALREETDAAPDSDAKSALLDAIVEQKVCIIGVPPACEAAAKARADYDAASA